MPIPLSVLIVEDMESDAQLIVRLLKKAGYEVVFERVETAGQMRAALEKQTWDIVISDYKMPQFDGRAALQLLQDTGCDIPFIVVSGAIGEETAVSILQAGAHDYLTKGDFARFVPAVERELAQAELRKERKQAEDALRESEDRYRTLVESSPDSICIHCEGKIVYVNAATVKLLHANRPEDLIGMKAIQFVHPDYQAIVIERIRRSYEDRQPASLLEEKFITLDGTPIEVEVITTPIIHNGKAATQLIIRDITERKRAEKALVESETKFRWLYEYAPMAYHLLTPDGAIMDVNHRWCELLGYRREEAIGKSIFDFVVDEEKDKAKASFEKKKQDKQPFVEGSERNFLTKDGALKIFKTYDFFVLDQGQNITFVQTAIEDITERVQVEEALAASETKLRALVEQVPAIVYTESAENGETLFISPQVEKLTGYTPTEWVKDRNIWKNITHPEDLVTLLAKDERTNTSREPFYIEYRIFTRDGRMLWIRDEAVIIVNQAGTPLFWQGVMYDITERKQTEEAIQTANILLEQTLEQSPVSMVLVSMPGGIIRSANSAYRRFLGIEDEPIPIGARLSDLKVSWQDFDMQGIPATAENLPLPSSLRGIKSVQERHIIRKDGTSVYGLVYGSPIFDAAGKVIAGYLVMIDITERKRAELELQQRKEDLELINMLNDVINRGESLEVLIDTLNNETKRIYSATACTVSLLSPDGKIMTIQRNTISPILVKRIERLIGQPIPKIHVHVREGGYIHKVLQNEEGTITSDSKLMQQWIMEFAENTVMSPVLGVLAKKFAPQIYKILNIGSTLAVPLTLGTRVIGLLELAGKDLFTEDILHRVRGISGQVTAAILRKRAEEGIRQRVTELEMLYQSGLALSQLLNPKEVGQKILDLLEEKLDWHHTRIRLYHPQDDSLELLDFNQPGLKGEMERHKAVERFQTLITRSGQGMSGWVVLHGQPVRSGDVSNDPRYVEAYPGIRSGLYVPMKLGERIVGVISIEDEQPDAFSEADERLIVTLANQAANAFENARLFEETRQRVMELETLNRISLALRAASRQNEMLSIVLDEALSILNTSHGSIELYNKTTNNLEKTITRGWTAQVIEPPQKIGEGIAGKVFTSGEAYISREFASDPETRAVSRSRIPINWGGACLPIRATQQTLGVMIVSVPSERELNKDEIRLLSILSEMTGAALQRMQLHEQTVRRLEQLNALRAVDQAISSSRDMRLTLNILLTHTISQLGLDAADVLLLHSGSSLLELVAGRGFHTLRLETASLSNSIAGRAIMERQTIMALDPETATLRENLQFGKLWEEEGFACYWCVPLIVKGEVKGALEVYRRTAFTPDAEWLEFLKALAGQAAIAIDSTQLFENLQRANLNLSLAYDATIEGWSRAMDLRDHETEGHTLRVTDLTVKLARAMRISESQLTAIRRGALLHDIGKMGVPDSILLKEGKLTDEEWSVMHKHPILARDMLLPIAYLNDALDIPYCHHEKWDGTGYPQGLNGDRIPLVARIFAVVDVWDALTNDRTYRRKWTKQEACQYIKDQSGRHFDPRVVDIFLKSIENG